jgi:predicted RNase H-like nuclease (RuvC/YqgF family)
MPETHSVDAQIVSTAEVPIGNAGLMLADIKQKLKQSELEKGRMKKSIKTLTERNDELQQELTSIKEECEKSRKIADRVHGLSASLTKKEAALSAAHKELESLQKTYEEAVLNSKNVQRELERDIRQLQRKVQIVEQQKELLDKELDLMRINRLSASDTLSLLPKNSAVKLASSLSHRDVVQPSGVALAAATAEVSRAEAAAAKLSRSRTQKESTSVIGGRAGVGESERELFFNNLVIPSTLDESAQDLNDIMIGK